MANVTILVTAQLGQRRNMTSAATQPTTNAAATAEKKFGERIIRDATTGTRPGATA